MVAIVRIPKLGLSDFGELVSWEVSIGEPVERGDVIAILESEKASAEIESSADGVLLGTYVEEGEEIAIDVGKPLAVVGKEGESVPSLDKIQEESTDIDDDVSESEPTSAPPAEAEKPADSSAVKATPRAKKRASETDVDLAEIDGTGPQGAITSDDIDHHLESGAESDAVAAGADDTVTVTESRELAGTRKTIADRLQQSAREKPHVMGTREIPIEQLERARERLETTHSIDLSLNDLLLFSIGRVLEDLPEFNAHFEDGKHELIEEVNIGYAVDGPRGLVVPVLDDVGGKSLRALSEARREIVNRVLEDEHTVDDLQGGTFTVTNVGVFGMDVSYSIINPPEVAILAIGRRKYAPVERDGDVSFEKVITFSLTIDHRVLDGADSGAFLERLAEYVENPERIFDDLEDAST